MHVYEGYTAIHNEDGESTLSGATPVRELEESKNTWKIPYCYYSPTEKGGSFLIGLYVIPLLLYLII